MFKISDAVLLYSGRTSRLIKSNQSVGKNVAELSCNVKLIANAIGYAMCLYDVQGDFPRNYMVPESLQLAVMHMKFDIELSIENDSRNRVL